MKSRSNDFLFRFFCCFLSFLIFFSGCASPSKSVEKSAQVPAWGTVPKVSSEEAVIGQKIHDEILSSFRPYTEPQALEYINKIGKNLAGYAERKDLPYQFFILYNDRIYATSAPGGHVYLTTGMIYFLENESELAAVLAHEIGELQYHDPKLSRGKKILESIVNGGAMIAPAFGQFGALAIVGLAMIKSTADAREPTPENKLTAADQRALSYMVKAGYDPQGLIDLQHKFLNAKPEIRPYFTDYYESRPISQERMEFLNKEFEGLSLTNQTFTTNRENFLIMTKGIKEIYRQ